MSRKMSLPKSTFTTLMTSSPQTSSLMTSALIRHQLFR
jgi:hypothetical protein